MKISKRDIGLLLLLLGIVAVILVYNFVYTPNLEKIDAEKATLVILQKQESELANLKANMQHYKDEIVRMQEEDEEIITHYPSQILPENEIMYAVELEEQNDIYFSALNYGSAAAFAVTGTEAATGIAGYDTVMSMTYQSTYQGLKDVILYNKEQNERRVINTLTASYDSTTGNLIGTMTLDQFSLTGTSNVYAAPYVPSMNLGTDNIFGTIEIPVDAAAGN